MILGKRKHLSSFELLTAASAVPHQLVDFLSSAFKPAKCFIITCNVNCKIKVDDIGCCRVCQFLTICQAIAIASDWCVASPP